MSAGQRNRKEDFYQPQFTRLLADHHIVESNVAMFPLFLRRSAPAGSLFVSDVPEYSPNLSPDAIAYLSDVDDTLVLFYHALALLNAPQYRTENAGALRQDWPRVPLPGSSEVLQTSANLGRNLAALMDVTTGTRGVTVGSIRPELRTVATIE